MTVYRRYESLDRLFAAAMTAEFTTLLDHVEQETADVTPARSRVIAAILTMSDRLVANDLYQALLQDDPETLLPLLTQRLGQTQRTVLTRLEALISAGLPDEGDGSIAAGSAEVYALTCLTLAQAFVVSRAAVQSRPGGNAALAELPTVLDKYLQPGG